MEKKIKIKNSNIEHTEVIIIVNWKSKLASLSVFAIVIAGSNPKPAITPTGPIIERKSENSPKLSGE